MCVCLPDLKSIRWRTNALHVAMMPLRNGVQVPCGCFYCLVMASVALRHFGVTVDTISNHRIAHTVYSTYSLFVCKYSSMPTETAGISIMTKKLYQKYRIRRESNGRSCDNASEHRDSLRGQQQARYYSELEVSQTGLQLTAFSSAVRTCIVIIILTVIALSHSNLSRQGSQLFSVLQTLATVMVLQW
jgi:hypothetical protein